ncbi:hypothetical protein C8Q80DRAFT_42418 [Daedaleopsis nitida]|nr:hypothetical protein C8Q80DRAFT_42418 [Daedaleopsis nitida]
MRPPRPTTLPPPPPAPDIVPRRRPRKSAAQPRISSNRLDPSPGLLALLVTVAGSSPAHARPLESEIPPDFLCPRLHQSHQFQPISSADPSSSAWAACDQPQASSSAKYKSAASPDVLSNPFSSSRKKRARGGSNNIADKYEQSPDGRWRKVDSWELYGSSSCAITQCMDSTATDFPVQDDQVSPSGELETTSVSTSSSSTPSLPNGWGKHSGADAMTGMILALSLCLAFALILFMMGIVLWRKKRRKDIDQDAEKTAYTRDSDDEASEEVKRARSQQRMWARASARWMANVRQSARRRRKRLTTVAAKGSDTGPIHDRLMPQASSSGVSLSRTHTATDNGTSHWSRPRSVRSCSPSRTRSRSSSPESSRLRHGSDVLPPQSLHPPAYISDTSQPRLFHRNPASRALPQISHAPLSPPPSSTSHSRLSPVPYEPPVHTAHVATDDKTILAQMAQLASAPPPADGSSSPNAAGGTSEFYPSVPLLEDDGFEPLPPELQCDVDANTSGGSTARRNSLAHDVLSPVLGASSPYLYPSDPIDSEVPSYTEDALRHPPLVLPPPPSKVPLTGPMFYEYPNEFEEDVATMEPPPGPSSPPFEEPSAPPFEEIAGTAGIHLVAPSAPPLHLSDRIPPWSERLIPSAPPLDLDELAIPLEADTSASGVEGSAPPSAPDDHGNVNAIPSAASSRETPRLGDASPPLYLP